MIRPPHYLRRIACGQRSRHHRRFGLAEQVADRHSLYFADFLYSFAPDLRHGVSQEALQTILPEQANLRVAWMHALEAEQWQVIADSLEGAQYFYQRQGLFSDEAALVDGAITAVRSVLETSDLFLTALLGRLLSVRARDYMNSAQFDEWVESAQQGCELARGLGDSNLEERARLAWARFLFTQHKREEALAQFEE